MENKIRIIEKPDWVSWDEIHEVLWDAHENNRSKGMNMAFPSLPGNEIRRKIENGKGKMLLAIDERRVIGTAGIIVKHANLWCGNDDYAYCCFASVLPSYNGMGIYRRLNLEREKIALEMGLDKMMFDTHEHNERKINVDKKVGFKLVDLTIWKDHYNVVMVKWLNGCPYSDRYCNIQFLIRKLYKKTRFKPGYIKRFGV